MVNGVFLRQFEKQAERIENILNQYFNSPPKYLQNPPQENHLTQKNQPIEDKKQEENIQTKQPPQPIEDLSRLGVTHIIQTQHEESGKISIGILKDKRIVSAASLKIIVYNHSYKVQFQIKNAHSLCITSLNVLRNGDLVSSGENIKIWRINKDDYQLTHTLNGHNNSVNRVIELNDGKICSCSSETTIKIWDNYNYQCVQTLTEHKFPVFFIIELNNFIISTSHLYSISPGFLRFSEKHETELIIWDKTTNKLIKNIKNNKKETNKIDSIRGVIYHGINALSKLTDKSILIGEINKLNILDIETYKMNTIEDKSIGVILCFKVLRNGLVLFGNNKGEICSYNPLSNQFIVKLKFHNGEIYYLLENEDNQLVSSSYDRTINVYETLPDVCTKS